jgi:tetratricopeptide (TPR) repeat protein
MAKSLVDKYEQILAQDPASTVFVELAKVLIEKGENPRAIEVCQRGLSHHADSVVGRVLWGKALIGLGRPAEAMEQFDAAISLDRENPHAYNLIGEVLLHKGLYRSALPLLRKAVALQPNDGRVRQWLEQTQAALAGGPAPILFDPTRVDVAAGSEEVVTDSGVGADGATAPPLDDEPKTDVFSSVTAPPQGAELGDSAEPTVITQARVPTPPPSRAVTPAEFPAVSVSAPEPDPFAQVPKRTSSSEVIGGLTSTFDALAEGAGPVPVFDPEVVERGPTAPIAIPDEPSVAVSDELLAQARGGAGLLGDLPEQEAPPEPPPPPAPAIRARPEGAPRASGGGFLSDIPDMPEPTSSLEVPKVEVSSHAAEAIAREYERELREKLAQSKAQKSFLARHWVKLAGATVGTLAVVLGAYVFLNIRQEREATLRLLGEARRGIYQDTRQSLEEALAVLDRVTRNDPRNGDAHALRALAHAVRYAEHGNDGVDREKALAALAQPGVEAKHPAVTRVVRYHVADAGEDKKQRAQALVDAEMRDPDLHELAGRILIEEGQSEAGLKRLQAALDVQAGHVRALVALGDHLRGAGQHARALEFYLAAKDVSERHPGRTLGAAECRLELGEDLELALAEVQALPPEEDLADGQRARRALALGRLFAATGQAEQGAELLAEGSKRYRARAYEFQLALGQAHRRAGKMVDAEKALQAALELRPRSDEAREALARVLIDRDRPREALQKAPVDPDSRRISLVRAAAYARLGNWKGVRTELERTRVGGRYPPEAFIQLALADAAEGELDRAQDALEKTLAVTRKARSEVLVALAQVHQQKGELDKARQRYEEAAKETDDVEGACAFGRMLLSLGLPDLAVAPLSRSAERNDSHEEAHAALVQALLMTGRREEAVERAEKWVKVTGSAAAYRAQAQALHQAGRAKDAERAANLAVRKESKNAAGYRIRSGIHFTLGDAKAAFRDLEQANKLDAKDAETFCEIAHAFLRQGNSAHAGAAFDAALRENPDIACGKVGAVYARLFGGKPPLKEVEAVAKDAPAAWERGFAQAARARAHLNAGKLKDAREAADEAVKLWPWSGTAQLVLGQVLVRQKDPAAAEVLGQAVALDPAHGPARVALADYLARGSAEEQAKAVDEYERFLQIGGDDDEMSRVKRTLPALKKRVASR